MKVPLEPADTGGNPKVHNVMKMPKNRAPGKPENVELAREPRGVENGALCRKGARKVARRLAA